MSEQTQDLEERVKIQQRADSAAAAARTGIESNARKVEENKFNPGFLGEIQDPKVDTDRWDWITEELGPIFSGAHMVGRRSEHFEMQQELLNMVKSEEIIAEMSPGSLLERHPNVLAVMQGVEGTHDPDYVEPAKQGEKRVVRDAMDVATTRQALSVDAHGIDAFTKATTETRQVTNEEEERSSVLKKAKEVVR